MLSHRFALRALVPLGAALLCLLVSPAVPAGARSSGDIRAELRVLAARLHEAEEAEGEAVDRLTKLERQIAKTERQSGALRSQLAGRLRAMYTGGMAGDSLVVLLTNDRLSERLDGLAMLEFTAKSDRELMLHAGVVRRDLLGKVAEAQRVRRVLAESRRELATSTARLAKLLGQLASSEQAVALRIRRPRASRERVVRAAAVSGRFACPAGRAHTFTNSWGDPRSGGRRHKGADIMAPYGSPAYAVTSGRITRLGYGGAGGITLYLRGDNGDTYYYAHNARNLVRAGQRVSTGQHIANIGNSGNARGGAAHIHFELHPGGGSAVNPYYFLRRICG